METTEQAVAENTNTETEQPATASAEPQQPSGEQKPAGEPPKEEGTLLGKEPQKAEGEEPAKTNAPEQYDFTAIMPEGTQLDENEVNEFSAIAKDLNLNQEQANKLAQYGFAYLGRGINAYEAQHQAEVNGWADNARKELGKDFDNTMLVCAKGLEAVEKQVPGIRAALNETGAGNRVEVIRAFKVLGELLQEDPGKGLGGAGSATTSKTWYPNSDK